MTASQYIICHVCREVVHAAETITIMKYPIYGGEIDYDAPPIVGYACKAAGPCMDRFLMVNPGREVNTQ